MRVLILLCLLLWCIPCYAVPITSPFGYRVHPITGEHRMHTGTDFGYEYGTPIGSVAKGIVVYSGPRGGYGNCVIVKHDNGDCTLYGHFSEVACAVGDPVEKGTLVGYVGSTGMSTGPHLHLEWWHDGLYTDPMQLLSGNYTLESVKPIDLGDIGYEPETDKAKKKANKNIKYKEPKPLTLTDYLMLSALRRKTGRANFPIVRKLRRRAMIKELQEANKPKIRLKAVNRSNGFDF